jgi:LuxR family transcriptional regulator, maltose regulon positive regulatory protein
MGDMLKTRERHAVRPGGWLVQSLLEEVLALVEQRATHDPAHTDLIREILEFRAELDSTDPRRASESLPDPLTASEARILRLLATDLSTREIGNELYVSVNTVKTHVKHLYAKLDVRSRKEAVERGRALGLLRYSSAAP